MFSITKADDNASKMLEGTKEFNNAMQIKAHNAGLGAQGKKDTLKTSAKIAEAKELLAQRNSQPTQGALTDGESRSLTRARERMKDLKLSLQNNGAVVNVPHQSGSTQTNSIDKSYEAIKMMNKQQQKIQQTPVTDNSALIQAAKAEVHSLLLTYFSFSLSHSNKNTTR
jgi:hypothetical protein